jgi:hypothetical protein
VLCREYNGNNEGHTNTLRILLTKVVLVKILPVQTSIRLRPRQSPFMNLKM